MSANYLRFVLRQQIHRTSTFLILSILAPRNNKCAAVRIGYDRHEIKYLFYFIYFYKAFGYFFVLCVRGWVGGERPRDAWIGAVGTFISVAQDVGELG